MRVPLYVSSADAAASTEWEPVETLVISLHGGMIRTRQQFPVGTTLDIRLRDTQRYTRGRVVWTATGKRELPFEVGFELLEPPGFWGFRFPEDKWAVEDPASFRRS
jgi:hypothetical protein